MDNIIEIIEPQTKRDTLTVVDYEKKKRGRPRIIKIESQLNTDSITVEEVKRKRGRPLGAKNKIPKIVQEKVKLYHRQKGNNAKWQKKRLVCKVDNQEIGTFCKMDEVVESLNNVLDNPISIQTCYRIYYKQTGKNPEGKYGNIIIEKVAPIEKKRTGRPKKLINEI